MCVYVLEYYAAINNDAAIYMNWHRCLWYDLESKEGNDPIKILYACMCMCKIVWNNIF